MTKLPTKTFAHMGFYVQDLERMTDFYTRVVGLFVTDSGDYYRGGEIRFLSGSPEEHHQIVLASGRPEGSMSTINQISFRLETLEDLRDAYATLAAAEVSELRTRNHGNAWSLYFHDPEDNRIEIYAVSPWYVSQPHGTTLDLTKPVAEIMAETEAFVTAHPSYLPAETWKEGMRTRFTAPA